MQEVVDFLKANQWSYFYKSLLSQYESKGSLSPRQVEVVQNAIEQKALKASQPKTFSIKPGEVIEVKAWIARRLQDDLSMSFFFRNLKIEQVLNESYKAYQVKVSFVATIVTSCHICGKDLDTEISRATGIGPVCADKLGLPRPTLETAQETLRALDALCQGVGMVGPIWIPKSQIKNLQTSIINIGA